MARALASFKQADLMRAVKAVQACGLAVVRTEIGSDGKIVLVHEGAGALPIAPLDQWRNKRDARQT